MLYETNKNFIFRRGCLKTEEAVNMGSDSPKCKKLSIKERVEAANYAMKVTGGSTEDEDVIDVVGEVYGG